MAVSETHAVQELLEGELAEALTDRERAEQRVERLRERLEVARIAADPDFQARTRELAEKARSGTLDTSRAMNKEQLAEFFAPK